MDVSRLQILAIIVTAGLFVLVFELVRRRRLLERYALLWLFSAFMLLAFAAWKGLLEQFASAIGIFYAPSALFILALGFVLLLLLHFSVAVSRLADQAKVLAQRVALLEEQLRAKGGEPATELIEEREPALAHSSRSSEEPPAAS